MIDTVDRIIFSTLAHDRCHSNISLSVESQRANKELSENLFFFMIFHANSLKKLENKAWETYR